MPAKSSRKRTRPAKAGAGHGSRRLSIFDEISIDSKPAGYRDVFDIVRAFDVAEELPERAVARIVEALRAFLTEDGADTQLRAFGKRARLLGKQGRRAPSVADTEIPWQVAWAAIARMRELIAAGGNPRRALADAIRETAQKMHRSIRTVQANVRAHGASVRQLMAASAIVRNRRADKS
jgi:hypothetical protein